MSTNVCNSSIHNCPKLETTKTSINMWMDKQIMIHSYNGTPLSNKTKLIADTSKIKMDKSQKALFWVKESKNKSYTVRFHFIRYFWKGKAIRDRNHISSFQMRVEGGNWWQKDMRDLFGLMEIFYIMIVVVVTSLYISVKIHRTVYLK